MRHPDTRYRGEKIGDSFRVTVADPDGGEHALWPALPLPGRESVTGFSWGYRGAGPAQLAHALVHHATGDRHLAAVSYRWFLWGIVDGWGDRWEVTGGQLAAWVAQWRREARAARLAERYDFDLTLEPDPAPDVVVDTPPPASLPPAPAWSQPAGRVRLFPTPAPDELEGGGV